MLTVESAAPNASGTTTEQPLLNTELDRAQVEYIVEQFLACYHQ